MKHQVLIAARPAAARILGRMLEDAFTIFHAPTLEGVFSALKARRAQPAAILCCISFDDSRMFDLIDALRRDAELESIPVVCCRVLPSILSEEQLTRLGTVCRHFGAVDYVDIAARQLAGADAAAELRRVLSRCVKTKL